MLTGQAKTDYQRGYMRGYMRRLRSKNKDSAVLGQKQGLKKAVGLAVRPETVKTHTITSVKTYEVLRPVKTAMLRPEVLRPASKLKRPDNISDNRWTMIRHRAGEI